MNSLYHSNKILTCSLKATWIFKLRPYLQSNFRLCLSRLLHNNIKKYLCKRSNVTKSGAAASSLPKCKYFDEMAFLLGKNCNRPSESNLQLQSTSISPPPSPAYAKSQEKNNTNTVSRVSGLSCKKQKVDETEVHLMKQLSDTDNDIKKLLTESESEDSLYCRSLVSML